MPQVQVKDSQVQVSQVPDPNMQDLQAQLKELHVQLEEPQVQLPKPQLLNPPVKLQVKDPIVKDHQSTLKAYNSYKEALGTSQKSKEIILSCEECSYPFKSKEELGIHIMRHNQLHCTKCNTDFKTKFDLTFHINYESNCERQWNCKDCGYQGNSPSLLKTHINEKHTEPQEVSFPCSMCNAVFNTKWYFMNHVRDNHIELKEICSHFQTGRCKFSEDDCWGRHLVSTSNNSFECHSCNEMFSTKNMMMKHRKLTHRTKQCNEFVKGTCKHGDEECWYMHKQQDFYKANMAKTSK